MKKALIHFEQKISAKNFPQYVLAIVAVLTMPLSWCPLVCAVISISFFYRLFKRNPDAFKGQAAQKNLFFDGDFWKQSEIHRFGVFAIAWFWCFLIRAALDARLFNGFTLANPGLFAIMFVPLFIYLYCAAHSFFTYPKKLVSISTLADRKKLQSWTNGTFLGFVAAFIISIVGIIWFPNGIGSWLNGWLVHSAMDANLINDRSIMPSKPLKYHDGSIMWRHYRADYRATTTPKAPVTPVYMDDIGRTLPASAGFLTTAHGGYARFPTEPVDQMCVAINAIFASFLIWLLWPKSTRLAMFLTQWMKLMNGKLSGVQESFVQTLHMPRTYLQLKEIHPFWRNTIRTFFCLLACYAILFALVGLSTGWLGRATTGWLVFALRDAHILPFNGAGINSHLRLFCAAIVALYFTVPLAVTAAVFIPFRRRPQIILSRDGVCLPDGPYAGLRFCPLRLWTDFAGVNLQTGAGKPTDNNQSLNIDFHSGGKLSLRLGQMAKVNLEKLLAAIDENALDCLVSQEVIDLRKELQSQVVAAPDRSELGVIGAKQFQSTIFMPQAPGTWLPDGETRVVRLLATRPLSCVYLVRTEAGKLGIAKQFFLADENEQSDALRKCFAREYDLLKKIDNPAIAKVLNVFHRDESTYLLLEHASGIDLRTLVAENGLRSEEQVIKWALQLCEIMIYLHTQDPPIVHRDLTPDNIVVAEDGCLRLIDFGAAHQFLEGITGTIIGKQCYIAPEQLRGQAGTASDIYSFGCTLYFVLTGEEPVALTQCDPSSKADITKALASLIMSCTEFSAEARPRSFAAVKDYLTALGEKPIQEIMSQLQNLTVGEIVNDSLKIPYQAPISVTKMENERDGTTIRIKTTVEQFAER